MSTAPQSSGTAGSAGKMPGSTADVALRNRYRQEFERTRRDFDATGSGLASLSDRTRLVDSLALTLWDTHSAGIRDCALIAVGGYGRSELFPHSDVDLLFLTKDEEGRAEIKSQAGSLCRELWDAGLRVSPSVRTLADCDRFDATNIEFTISLLDCRFLAGDFPLFEQLHTRILPQLVARESDALLQALSELTQARHHRFGNTIFHLEPNLKDGPGGLRDCHLARWIGTILALTSGRKPEVVNVAPEAASREMAEAMEFLSSGRCYLHYAQSRDENVISWAAQEEMARRGVATGVGPIPPAEWMRMYFRHAKAVHRNSSQLLAQVSRGRSSLYRSFQQWRSRVSNADFSVIDGQVYFQQGSAARDAATVLRLFAFIARHGVTLSPEAERRLNDVFPSLTGTMPQDRDLWAHLRELVVLPHAAESLRAMHALNLLTRAIPEFETIDLLVLRDLYHRYTVDEHTFMTIEVLHRLKEETDPSLQAFAGLYAELEHPELLFLALLLHDTGKGLEGTDHVHSSLQFAQGAVKRLGLAQEDAWMVCFLVASHLEISSTLRRRDIYDPATTHELAEKMGTPERLKMLTLMTLADIKAVNPDALTPWKAENLWRLYTGTASYFDRSADDVRLNAEVSSGALESVIQLLPGQRTEVLAFLEGLPQRYLLTHPAEQVAEHFDMAKHMHEDAVQVALRATGGQQEISVVTGDRHGLFRTVAGILYGWGMDITKAGAFSNRGGIVVDTFAFQDRFRTLELNPSERERFKRSVRDVLMGKVPLERLLEPRRKAVQKPVKLTVETRLRYDNESSTRSTLLEIVTQDRPGLLYTISATLTAEECDIEVALIDTEGPMAHDVFYITSEGKKLSTERMRTLEWALAAELSDSMPSNW